MRLPNLVDYHAAVQHPATAFADPELRVAAVAEGLFGLPKAVAGNFAVTYQLQTGTRWWAVRCFHRDVADRQRRYAAVSQVLAQLRAGPFVPVAYLPTGVRVANQWYPITKMPWLEGVPFNLAVETRLRAPAALAELERRFVTLVADLQRQGLAHGDLQHGNILVEATGALRLVDYDGLFVPALGGLPASESGDPNYQHPRRADQFDAELDRFSAIVITLALRALAAAPQLWAIYNTGDNLLFRRADFLAPDRSALFRDLAARPATRELAARFAAICVADYAQVPALEAFLSNGRPDQNSLRSATSARGAGSPFTRTQAAVLNRLYGAPSLPGSPGVGRPWKARRAMPQHCVAFSPDGRLLASADQAGTVRVRDTATGRTRHTGRHGAAVCSLAFSPDGQLLALAGADGWVSLWAYAAGSTLRRLRAHPSVVHTIAFSPDGLRLASGGDGPALMVWEIASGRELRRLVGHSSAVHGLAFSADGRLLVSGGADGTVRCWEVATGRCLGSSWHGAAVAAVSLAPDGGSAASGGTNGQVRVWEVPSGRERVHITVGEVVGALAFAPDGTRLAAAGRGQQIHFWDPSTGQAVGALGGYRAAVSSLDFSPDGQWLASASWDGSVWLRAARPRTDRGVAPGRSGRRRPAAGPSAPTPRKPRRRPAVTAQARATPVPPTQRSSPAPAVGPFWLLDLLRRMRSGSWFP